MQSSVTRRNVLPLGLIAALIVLAADQALAGVGLAERVVGQAVEAVSVARQPVEPAGHGGRDPAHGVGPGQAPWARPSRPGQAVGRITTAVP